MCNSVSHKTQWSRHTDIHTAQHLLAALVLPDQGWLSNHRGGSTMTHGRGYSGSVLHSCKTFIVRSLAELICNTGNPPTRADCEQYALQICPSSTVRVCSLPHSTATFTHIYFTLHLEFISTLKVKGTDTQSLQSRQCIRSQQAQGNTS